MFRNQYDSDITTFSPQGRLHQLEYAMEAVKQGSATVAIKGKECAVVVCLRRKAGDLGGWQDKLIRIDDHIGLSYSGLSSDARLLSNSMRTNALQSKLLYQAPISSGRLLTRIADKAQQNTQKYGSRPFGVGFLAISWDQEEEQPHVYEFSPSGNVFDYYAMAIGGRSQSCKTYLEKHVEEFDGCNLPKLVVHALLALRDAIPPSSADKQGEDFKAEDVSVGVVGRGLKFQRLTTEDIGAYVAQLPAAGNVVVPEVQME